MEPIDTQRHNILIQALSQYILPKTGITVSSVSTGSILPPEVIDHMMLEVNIHKYFNKAFTHQSYSYENSYEQLEFSGDLLCNMFVYKKVKRVLPNLDPEESTNICSYYKSNEIFEEALTSSIPGADSLILVGKGFTKTQKIYADVFEALIQAIYESSNSFMPGIGYGCAENVFNFLTRNITIEQKRTAGHPKQVATALLGKNTLEETGEEFDRKYRISVRVRKEGIDELTKLFGKPVKIDKEFTSVMGNKGLASRNAYEQIVDTLEENGITPDTVAERKMNQLIDSSPNKQAIFSKMKKNNETLKFRKTAAIEGKKEWLLIATSSLGEKHLIASVLSDSKSSDFHIAKLELLKKYALEDPRYSKQK